MEYKVIIYTMTVNDLSKEEVADKFARKVNEYLELGWKTTGGVTYYNGTFCQAIVYENKE